MVSEIRHDQYGLQVTKTVDQVDSVPQSAKSTSELPRRLLTQSVSRLQKLSLALTCVVLISWLGVNALEGELASELSRPVEWLPNAVILTASLSLFWLTWRSRLSASRLLLYGLVYEILVSWCIPISQYWNAFLGIDPESINGDLVGISLVALWVAFFTILVPVRPRWAMLALALSCAAVPVTMTFLIRVGNAPSLPGQEFFFIFVLPYLIVAILAYFAARLIYGLGKEVRKAQELGSYRLLKRIGQGGMGEVWLARHNLLARPAAIKLIRREALESGLLDSEAALARFEREAQATADLQSPHTVQLYDFGVSEDGSLFYVMELLEGLDLETLVRRFGPLPPERVIYILRQICHSLAEAHRRGLVHRDIKPANIFLGQRAFAADFAKVLDFGLVKILAPFVADNLRDAAATKAVTGTPAYMAPEIILGKESQDGRADLYLLSCVAFFLLTGRRVFEADSIEAFLVAHTTEVPSPPSQHCNELVPTALDDLVLSGLAKEPADRPQDAQEMARQLGQIQTECTWTEELAASWWRTHVPELASVG